MLRCLALGATRRCSVWVLVNLWRIPGCVPRKRKKPVFLKKKKKLVLLLAFPHTFRDIPLVVRQYTPYTVPLQRILQRGANPCPFHPSLSTYTRTYKRHARVWACCTRYYGLLLCVFILARCVVTHMCGILQKG